MPAMRRAVRILALLLTTASICVFVRSFFARDSLTFTRVGIERPGNQRDLTEIYEIATSRGRLYLAVSEDDDWNTFGFGPDAVSPPPQAGGVDWTHSDPWPFDIEHSSWGSWRRHWGGFVIGGERYAGNAHSSDLHYAIVPGWPALLLLTILAVASLRLDRWPRPGCCRTCGYNLTGNTSGTCPECGVNLNFVS